jgi:hypothetical protein
MEKASSGQRKARREARRRALVSGGPAVSACSARSSASWAFVSGRKVSFVVRDMSAVRLAALRRLVRLPGRLFPVWFVSIMAIDLRAPCAIRKIGPVFFFKARCIAQAIFVDV